MRWVKSFMEIFHLQVTFFCKKPENCLRDKMRQKRLTENRRESEKY